MRTFIRVNSFNITQGLHRLVLKLNAVTAHCFPRELAHFSAIARALSFGHCNATERNRVASSDRVLIHTCNVQAEKDTLRD